MKPTVGRIILYTNLGDADGKYPPEQMAAIITKVKQPDTRVHHPEEQGYDVWIHIFYPTGQFDMEKVPFSSEFKRGHWTWTPRVES